MFQKAFIVLFATVFLFCPVPEGFAEGLVFQDANDLVSLEAEHFTRIKGKAVPETPILVCDVSTQIKRTARWS